MQSHCEGADFAKVDEQELEVGAKDRGRQEHHQRDAGDIGSFEINRMEDLEFDLIGLNYNWLSKIGIHLTFSPFSLLAWQLARRTHMRSWPRVLATIMSSSLTHGSPENTRSKYQNDYNFRSSVFPKFMHICLSGNQSYSDILFAVSWSYVILNYKTLFPCVCVCL